MSALVVEVDGRVLRLEGKPGYRIGRAIEADVVLTAGSVSRQHAEIQRSANGGWVLVDKGSQFGTYVDDERITEHPLEQRTTVRCGPPTPGATLTIVPAEQYDDSATPVAPAPPPPMPTPDPTQPPYPAAAPPAPAQPGSERFAPGGAPAAPGAPPPPTPAPAPSAPGHPGSPVAPPMPAGARPAGTPGLPPAGVGEEATQILAAMPAPGQYAPGAPQQPRSGPDLLVVAEGKEHRFRHPAVVTVGRRSDSVVVITDPACSREHGRIDAFPGGWTYTNLSNEGSYDDGRRVATTRFDERLSLRLGHPVAGPELTLVPILSAAEEERRFAKRRMRKRLARTGIAALALLLIAGIGLGFFLVTRDGDDDSKRADGGKTQEPDSMSALTAAELDSAKTAAVKISAETTDLRTGGPAQYGGSGSIIRSDGLILTNAHVAQPQAEGLAERYGEQLPLADPEYVLIHLTDGKTDTNAPAAYRARVVEVDGNLDVAVIQIYADAEGNDLDGELDLPTVPIGDSKDLSAGDDVTVLGFPAVAGPGDSITVTKGVISNVNAFPELGERAEIDTDARIAPGNSGGMAINNDAQLIGIPSAVLTDSQTAVASGRIRSIDAVKDLIEKAEDETD